MEKSFIVSINGYNAEGYDYQLTYTFYGASVLDALLDAGGVLPLVLTETTISIVPAVS